MLHNCFAKSQKNTMSVVKQRFPLDIQLSTDVQCRPLCKHRTVHTSSLTDSSVNNTLL